MSSHRRRRRRRPVPRKPSKAATPRDADAKTPPVKTPPVKTESATPTATTPNEQAPSGPAPVEPAAARPAPVKPKSAPQPAAEQPKTAKDPYIGRTIGRCRIQERIGLGKTAAVYRAHYEALDDFVAMKILTPQARAMPELVARFHTEAKVIARLDNENVVKIYDVGSDGDDHFMVMELLDGFSVLDLIQRETQVETMDALRVVRQAANGLAAAHAQGIVHRDIKPQNLLLLEDGTVKVLDFGLAAQFDDKNERVGTPHYMAPEVCEDGTADLGTDIYALGIVLYHLLVGQPPYAGHGIKQILRSHIEGKPLRPERERVSLGTDVGDIVRQLTKRDPLTRPTAEDVVALLDAFGGEQLREKGTLTRRKSRSRARVEARKKSPLGPALAGIAVVVGIVIAVSAMSGSDGGGSNTPDDPSSIASVPDTPTDPNPIEPILPAETDPERMARERAEAEAEKARQKEKKEKDGLRALEVVETWARTNWHGATDTTAVIDKYQSVYSRYKGTAAATTARERLRGIKAKTVHPHPDRSWSDSTSIAEAREQWRAAKPEIETLINEHRYGAAVAKLPKSVNDTDGRLSSELEFWETSLGHLRAFKSEFTKHVKTLDDQDRVIQTPDGEGQVRIVESQSMKIRMRSGLETYRWDQLEPAEILKVARAAFTDKGTRFFVYQLAFAYAHRLQDVFWDLQLDLGGAPDIATFQRVVADYETRFDARLKDR